MFAIGVILFCWYAGHPPFQHARPSDHFYSLLKNNKPDLFWMIHSERKPNDFYSHDFKSLIDSNLNPDPKQRVTLADLVAHPWLQG